MSTKKELNQELAEDLRATLPYNGGKLIRNDNVICFDVDDTLIMWGEGPKDHVIKAFGLETPVSVHKAHVEAIKQARGRGHYVIVWSQGGWEWAEAVIYSLGIMMFVDKIMTKPKWMYDDIKPNDWTKVLYKPFKE